MSRRIAAVLAATALAGAALATTATAAPPSGLESYAAGSTATAFELNVGGADGLNLAVSRTGAVVNDGPQAAADGAALLIAGNPVPGDAPSAAPEGPESNEVCAVDIDLDEESGGQLSLLEVILGCVETEASIDDGAPSSLAVSGELQVTVLAPGGELLAPILAPVLEGLDEATDALTDGICDSGLNELLCEDGAIEENLGIEPLTLLNALIEDLQDETFVVAQITVAPTASQASADDDAGAVGQAGANGATITVLPGIAQDLFELGFAVPAVTEPLATISVGQSLASVVRDPSTGAASTDGSAAQLASISVSEEDLGVLNELTEAINDGLAGLAGNPLNCDLENPLADLVCIDLGEVREQTREQLAPLGLDFGEGTVGIQSSAATVRVLQGASEAIGGDLVTLQLATATAAANAAPVEDLPAAPEEPAPPAQPDTPRDLPRTGADGLPLGVLAGMLGLAVVGGALVRRTALS
jgi:hypothetical protein